MLLNNLLSQKATQTRQEAISFESSLASEFRSLKAKSGENLNKINEQVDLLSEQAELENDIANRIAKISAMFSKNALLEVLVYKKIDSKLDQFPKKTEEDEIKVTPPTTKSEDTGKPKKPKQPKFSLPSPPQKKLAEGGVVPPTGYEDSNKFISKAIPYADVLAVSLKTSGISSITILGEFIKATQSLGGFFAPYLKSVVNPFALALGVDQNIINTLLGGPVQAATLSLRDQQRYFGKTWSKFLNDKEFIDKFIDREMDPDDPSKPRGYVPANWKDDPAFTAELNRVAQKFNINANDLLAVMLVETGGTLRPDIRNPKSKATGLIQFLPSTARGLGTTIDELARMSRAEQMKYVEKYLVDNKLPQGATGGQIYAAVFLPAFINDEVLTVKGEDYYESNEGLDYNRDNKITRTDLNEHVEAMKKRYKLQRGDSVGNLITPMSPYIMSGPEAGYNVKIQGYDVTLHGEEVVVPFGSGFQVYPVKNRRYDITEDPIGVAKRWKEIAHGSNAKMTTFSSGGSAEFWQMAAITAREDTLHPQGQADVAQALYNRIAVGSYPGGRNLLSIITAPDQFEPTFKNRGSWLAIRDRNSAIAAAGNQKIVDMAASSITNPSLQKEAAKFVGGRTDFQGESQKKFMKPGDITRGKNHNFFGWFYDARLAKPAAVPKMISSQNKVTATANKSAPKVIVNRTNQSSQPNIIQQAQSAVVTFTNMVFNPHRTKRELNMKHVR